MKAIKNGLVLLTLAAALAACGGGGGHHHNGSQTATKTDFTGFVKSLFNNTSDSAEPVSINNRDFKQGDNNNSDAYNGILTPGD